MVGLIGDKIRKTSDSFCRIIDFACKFPWTLQSLNFSASIVALIFEFLVTMGQFLWLFELGLIAVLLNVHSMWSYPEGHQSEQYTHAGTINILRHIPDDLCRECLWMEKDAAEEANEDLLPVKEGLLTDEKGDEANGTLPSNLEVVHQSKHVATGITYRNRRLRKVQYITPLTFAVGILFVVLIMSIWFNGRLSSTWVFHNITDSSMELERLECSMLFWKNCKRNTLLTVCAKLTSAGRPMYSGPNGRWQYSLIQNELCYHEADAESGHSFRKNRSCTTSKWSGCIWRVGGTRLLPHQSRVAKSFA